MIWNKHKCIFTHVPKTAGTTVEKMFENAGEAYCGVEKHVKASAMRTKYPKEWETYFKFSIVRNPWDRIYSVWYQRTDRSQISLPFKAFLKSLPRKQDDLTYSQNSWVQIKGSLAMDKVWRFENRDEMFTDIIKMFSLPSEIPHVYKMENKPPFTDVYDEESVAIVERLYADDIKTWGYSFPR